MRNSSFLCIGWLPILLISLLLLALTSAFKFRDIEQGVKESASTTLSTPEFQWAKVETFNRGRDVLITGAAPNKESIKLAEKLAGQAYGVRTAKHSGEALIQIPPSPVELNAASDGNTITLSGSLASQQDVNKVVTRATELFGAGNVVNNLTVGDNLEAFNNVGIVDALRFKSDGSSNVTASLKDKLLVLEGQVPSLASSLIVEERFGKSFPGEITNQLKVVVPPVPLKTCQDRINELLTQGKINFESGKASISQNSHALLDQIKEAAAKCAEAKLHVAGHTDNTGNFDFNMALSLRRAQAVVEYLVAKGMSEGQFSASGHGPKQPVASNSSEQGRAQNRRIEIKLTK